MTVADGPGGDMGTTHHDLPEQAGSTRRTVLRGGVLAVGTTAVWTAPVASVLGLSPLSAAQASTHEQPPPPATTYTPGTWLRFTWTMDRQVVPILPFTGGARVLLVDAFLKGDEFELLEGAVLLGRTSAVEDLPGSTDDPDTAWADPTYSKGIFFVGPGSHALTVRVFTPYPTVSGAAFYRIDPAVP